MAKQFCRASINSPRLRRKSGKKIPAAFGVGTDDGDLPDIDLPGCFQAEPPPVRRNQENEGEEGERRKKENEEESGRFFVVLIACR